ncbi:MAG TPA: hypothetical protein VFT15_16965 [Chitinophagaceae bacterium]|nr:hypothetical protein [Chitinophagaceae bacterium]
MKNKLNMKAILLGFGLLSLGISYSQDTTKKKGTVDITSAFRPVLKESAKINFNASPAVNDTTKPRLNYDIPNQNLVLGYAPGSLRPLALDIDSGGFWDLTSYIKAGFGSLKTPFVQAGFSFGDGRTAGLNIYAKHVSSSGKILYQDYRNTNVDLKGFFQTSKSLEWNAQLGMRQDRYYKYGLDPTVLSIPPKDSLEQSFQTWRGGVGFHNINRLQYGISYAPEILINVFNDERKNSESNTYVNLPLQKAVGKTFSVNLGATFDLTRYKPDNKSALDNTFWYISPSIVFKTPKVNAQAGIRPSWDNKTFKMFPNMLIEASTEDQRFTFQAGWSGFVRRTSYQYLASINPYIDAPADLKNTWVVERYAGFKGSLGDHFIYNAKLAYNKYKNQPLFVNDNSTLNIYDNTFRVIYEPEMKAVHFGGEIGYTEQEKFSVLASIKLNKYFDIQENDKAYGLVPFEMKGTARVQVIKDLWLKSDVFLWDGAQYKTPAGNSAQLDGSFDVNAGLEFRITKNLNLWTQFNNILNREYEPWKLYRSYGFNFLAGIIFAFDQKSK